MKSTLDPAPAPHGSAANAQAALQQRALTAFDKAFGGCPGLVARAPGRVNLIGEHTDYNDGFVLPCAIDVHTLVAARARDDGWLHVVAADHGDALDRFRVDEPVVPQPDRPWTQYVRGVVHAMQARGLALRGGQLAIAGNVPQGAGLSSSASLEVALGQALSALAGLQPLLPPTELALIGQAAENHFVGCACGIMDQLISARGRAGHALLIDCRSLEVQPVPLPPGLAVMILHSRVARGLVESAYNERRRQCQAAADHFGAAALRDLDLATLQARAAGLDPVAWHRARHVVTENTRTQAAAAALVAGDLHTLGRLMAESHASMRDDFEITVPAVDELVHTVQQAIGSEGGARMTGGGFGGCVVALLPQAAVARVVAAVQAQYRAPNGESATVWVCQAAEGVSLT